MDKGTIGNDAPLFDDEGGLLGRVRVGMAVRDAADQELGTVEFVKMGDPVAVTTRGNDQAPGNLVAAVAQAIFGGVELPEAKRDQLLRYGFVRIDGSGLTDTDRFVRGDRIKAVSSDTVTLSLTRDQLPIEQ